MSFYWPDETSEMLIFAPEMDYTFRKAEYTDVPRIMDLIREAKLLMAAEGRRQWEGAYPAESDIRADIEAGAGHTICLDDKPVAYAALVLTGEPTYGRIEGRWLTDGPYLVLHRLATRKGARLAEKMIAEAEEYARRNSMPAFRIDTNYDNAGMLHILPKLGFTYCGEITLADGSPRKAFEKKI